METISSFLRSEQLNTKYRVFLQGFPVSMVTFYVTIMTASSSAIIAGTITFCLVIKCFSVNPSNNKVS